MQLSVCIFVLLYVTCTSASQPLSGAIWTTTADGSVVNANIYASKEDVYLNGGPQGCCTCGGLPDDNYYFQVTDPAGQVLLSTDDVTERAFQVTGGVITLYQGTHVTATGKCSSTTIQLMPYDDTPNPGGEYKAWVTPISQYDPTAGNFGFKNAKKTDNFKVRTADVPGDTNTAISVNASTDAVVTCNIQPSPCSYTSCRCDTVTLIGSSLDQASGVWTLRYQVTNVCPNGLETAAFGINTLSLAPNFPPPVFTGTGNLGFQYDVSVQQIDGYPPFQAVVFTNNQSVNPWTKFSNGASDVFELEVLGWYPSYPQTIQIFQGAAWDNFVNVNFSSCECAQCGISFPPPNPCPAGWAGAGCAQCEDLSSQGAEWWCAPDGSGGYVLQRVTSPPSVGFPANSTRDPNGYLVSCNCTIQVLTSLKHKVT